MSLTIGTIYTGHGYETKALWMCHALDARYDFDVNSTHVDQIRWWVLVVTIILGLNYFMKLLNHITVQGDTTNVTTLFMVYVLVSFLLLKWTKQ